MSLGVFVGVCLGVAAVAVILYVVGQARGAIRPPVRRRGRPGRSTAEGSGWTSDGSGGGGGSS